MDIQNIPDDASVYEILRGVMLDKRVNFVRVAYGGKAAQPILGWFRSQTGETQGEEGISHMVLDRFVSGSRGNLNLTLAFDRSAREIDASDPENWLRYGVRSRTIGNVRGELNVETISVNFRGQTGWVEIDLRGRNIFPAPSNADEFVALQREMAQLTRDLEIVSNDIKSIKGKAKRRDMNRIESGGFVAECSVPEGKTFAIVDQEGNRVPANHITEGECVGISICEDIAPTVETDREINSLPERMNKANEIRTRISEIVKIVRPIELGLIERHADLESFKLRGVKFAINRWTSKDYGHSPETRDRIEAGDYQIAEVDKTRSQWTIRPVVAIEVENIAEAVPQRV